ncbi:hypothetical protein G9A89_008118 [Geosiphon pyriformis]|nr:hypothetical protein G9A89_008118 [Geosiphon pyriformis]
MTVFVSSEKIAYIFKEVAISENQTFNYAKNTLPIIESTEHYYFPIPPNLPITFGASCEVINPQRQNTPEIHKSGNYWNIQQSVKSDSKEYKDEFNNSATTQAKFTSETPQTPRNPHPWGQHSWTKSLGKYRSLFGNLIPIINKTDGNMLTWKTPPTQLLTKSSITFSKKTAILQSIGKINKGKQPELALEEHPSIQTPNPSILTNKTPSTHQIMAY